MLAEMYDDNDVPEKDRIPLEKDVLLTVPEKDYDISGVLSTIGRSRWEVAVTWPKDTVDMLPEITAAKPRVVVQVGRRFFKQFPVFGDAGLLEQIRSSVPDEYVNLHHHDDFSIRDGLGTVDQLIKVIKSQRRSFCAVTNHGSVGGWIRQYNACKKSGVKVIFGMEAYVSDYRGDDPELKKAHRSANHLVLLAKNKTGFYNIIRIHNDAQLNGFYYTPRVERAALDKWGEGIVALSSCCKGEIPCLLVAGKKDEAKALYERYAKAFDKFFVEIQIIEHTGQVEVNRLLIQFAKEVGAPLILTCDSHYLEAEHSDTHDMLMCIRQGKTIFDKDTKDEDVWNFDVKNLYYRNAEQMRLVFERGFEDEKGSHPPFKDDVFTEEVFAEAMANTIRIARDCESIVLDSKVKLPKLYTDAEGMLRDKVNKGFKDRKLFGRPDTNDYLARVKREFEVIVKLGWADYFLVMEKIISDARDKYGEWAIGYGRGSAAGSLVSYCLWLTDIDPIQYGLMFERFLDEGRPDPPDIDTDFDPRIRDWVKAHIVELFGADNVCSIGTYSSYRTSSVILDVARVLNLNVAEANVVTKKFDPLKEFENDDGQAQKVDKLPFDVLCEHYPELKKYFDEHPEVRHHAEILRNQTKNMGKHAGGVIISDTSLRDRIPVLWDKVGDPDRQVMSAWAEGQEKSELSSVGLVKFDILGLANLPVISDCIALVEKTRGIKIRRADIPIDDKTSIKMGSKDDLVGIFQLENPATKPVADEVGLESLLDVAALTSLIRPGPRDMGMDMEYAKRKHGQPYELPALIKDALSETYGVLTYQEQAMRISQVVAGFDGPQANKLRKAIGKKIESLMAEMKLKFVKGAQPKIEAGQISIEEVERIFALIETFAGYGFNKSHAVTYSAISTVQLWLKYHYFAEYMTALIDNSELGKKKHGYDVFVHYINHARRRGLEVLCPDINTSGSHFSLENGAIRFSLSHVKMVASQAIVIESFQPFKSIEDFHERVKVETTGESGKKTARRPNKRVVENLIAAGAFDKFGSRNEVMTEYYRCRDNKKEVAPQHTQEEWWDLEKETLGICLSRPPLYKSYSAEIAAGKWRLVSEASAKKKVKVFGRIESVEPHTSRAGASMYIAELSDGLDSLRFWVFHGAQQFFREHLRVGSIAAVPLSKFDDDDRGEGMRFFDEDGEIEVIEK